MNQPAPRVKRVCDSAFEDSQFQSAKQHFDAVPHAGDLGTYRLKNPFKPAGSLWMVARIIEELIKSGRPAAFPGSYPVLRRSVPDDGLFLHTNLRDQRFC